MKDRAQKIAAGVLAVLAMAGGRELDAHAHTPPPATAAEACAEATAAGYYTADLWTQCLDDWHSAGREETDR